MIGWDRNVEDSGVISEWWENKSIGLYIGFTTAWYVLSGSSTIWHPVYLSGPLDSKESAFAAAVVIGRIDD